MCGDEKHPSVGSRGGIPRWDPAAGLWTSLIRQPVESADQSGQDELTPELLGERQRIPNLDELVMDEFLPPDARPRAAR